MNRRIFSNLIPLVLVLCSCATTMQRGAVQRAYFAYNHADYKSALRHLSRAETYGEVKGQALAEVHFLRGQCLEGLKERTEAIGVFEFVIKTYPETEFAARAQGRLAELKR